jgi:hypothetical protein
MGSATGAQGHTAQLFATAAITMMSRIPTPTQPRTIPAIAIPRPDCVPPVCLIWLSATYPKTRARIEPTQYSQIIPSTIDAIASPFVPVLCTNGGGGGANGGGGGGAGLDAVGTGAPSTDAPHEGQK